MAKRTPPPANLKVFVLLATWHSNPDESDTSVTAIYLTREEADQMVSWLESADEEYAQKHRRGMGGYDYKVVASEVSGLSAPVEVPSD